MRPQEELAAVASCLVVLGVLWAFFELAVLAWEVASEVLS